MIEQNKLAFADLAQTPLSITESPSTAEERMKAARLLRTEIMSLAQGKDWRGREKVLLKAHQWRRLDFFGPITIDRLFDLQELLKEIRVQGPNFPKKRSGK